MKKALVFMACLVLVRNIVIAQTDFLKGIDINNNDGVACSALTPDKGVLICGSANFAGPGGNDLIILKFDSLFNVEWLNKYNDTTWSVSDFQTTQILPVADSGFILCGFVYQPVQTGALIRFDKTGNMIWQKRYYKPNTIQPFIKSIISVNDSEYVFTGAARVWCVNSYDDKIFICKINNNGNILWSKYYRNASFTCNDEQPWQIINTSDNGFLIAGSNHIYGSDGFVMNLDSNGNFNWYKIYQQTFSYTPIKVFQHSGDAYYLAGNSYLSNIDFSLMKIDSAGNVIWNKSYDFGGHNQVFDFMPLPDSNFMFIGNYSSGMYGGISILQTDLNGNIITSNVHSDSTFFSIRALHFLSDSSILFNGSLISPVTNSRDICILKEKIIGGVSCVSMVSSVTDTTIIPAVLNMNYLSIGTLSDTLLPINVIPDSVAFVLYGLCDATSIIQNPNPASCIQLFPNPATDYFELHMRGLNKPCEIKILDVMGKEIFQSVILSPQSEVKINMQDFSPGVYFVKVTANGNSSIQKVVKY